MLRTTQARRLDAADPCAPSRSAGPSPLRRALALALTGLLAVSCGAAPQEALQELGRDELPPERQLDLASIDYDPEEVRKADKRLKDHLEDKLKQTTPVKIDIKHYGYDAAVSMLVDRDEDSDYVAWLTPYVYVVAEMLGAKFEVVGTYRSTAVLEGRDKRLEALTDELSQLEDERAALAETGGSPGRSADDVARQLKTLDDRQAALKAQRKEMERDPERAGYTYRSYLVINKAAMANALGREDLVDPGLPAFEEYLQALNKEGRRPTFYYHNKFSTSSFFLPSVYLRDQGMVDLVQPKDLRVKLDQEGQTISSKRLVEEVAGSTLDEPAIAAVWDDTKTAFESGDRYDNHGKNVHFIALENELPNDLLVVSSSMTGDLRDGIRKAIADMPPDDESEFKFWRPIDVDETRRARSALVGLRQLAYEQIQPVTVKIQESEVCPDDDSRSSARRRARDDREVAERRMLRQAAEDAIRLSGTEFVLWNEFYANYDFVWQLEPIHDGAVKLCSAVEAQSVEHQVFPISYEDPTNLTERIGDLIRSRMHRLRHVWPYSKADTPTILRDVDFSVDKGQIIQVQKISWEDRKRNDFKNLRTFDAEVLRADPRKFELSSQHFDGGFNSLEPISYRAVLLRPSEERPLFTALTIALIVLFLAATVAAALEFRRAPFRLQAASSTDVIDGAFASSVRSYHRPWRTSGKLVIAEADVLGQDRDKIEEFISELKLAEGPWWQRLARRLTTDDEEDEDAPTGLTQELLVQRDEIGGTTRLAGLIEYLARRGELSDFTGTLLEFEAWNRAACKLFSRAVSDDGDPDDAAVQLLHREGACLSRLLSKHFDGVLNGARRSVSLFQKVWETHEDKDHGSRWIWRCEEELPVALDPGVLALAEDAGDAGPIHRMVLEFKMERPINLTIIDGQLLEAWLLGVLDRRPALAEDDAGQKCLRLHFKPLALLRGPEC